MQLLAFCHHTTSESDLGQIIEIGQAGLSGMISSRQIRSTDTVPT